MTLADWGLAAIIAWIVAGTIVRITISHAAYGWNCDTWPDIVLDTVLWPLTLITWFMPD